MTRIKICGLTRAEDVAACIEETVELVGFNFWPKSRRYLAPRAARALVDRLPSDIVPVGVFVEAAPAEVAEAVAASGVRAIQLHGDEDPALYRGLGADLVQVVRLGGGRSLPSSPAPAYVRHVLLDAAVEGFGGRGASFDWSQVEALRRLLARDVIVAGGLHPGNVATLVEQVRPWGVDVASGVESAPGVKDREKLRAFVRAVRALEEPR